MKKIAYFSNVHWEPNSSAAGRKTAQVLFFFQSQGYQCHYFSSALKSDRAADYQKANVTLHHFEINAPDCFTPFAEHDFEWIIYDRFMLEEQLSWILKPLFPNALHCIESQDFHSLRKLGLEGIQNNTKDPLLLRETAAYLRSDAVFIISRADLKALKQINYPADNLVYWPFESNPQGPKKTTVSERKDFFFIGNGYHEPNIEAILKLKQLWPEIRKKTKANLHVYGAYLPPKIHQLQNVKEGFIVHGAVTDSGKMMQSHRLQLVPLSSGAGLKGKILEAIENGCISLGTSHAYEGYDEAPEHLISFTDQNFIEQAILLYQEEHFWLQSLEKSERMLGSLAPKAHENSIADLFQNQIERKHRESWIYQLLNSEHLQSKKYLSLYIQGKQKDK